MGASNRRLSASTRLEKPMERTGSSAHLEGPIQRAVFHRQAPGGYYSQAIIDALRQWVPSRVQVSVQQTDFANSYTITFTDNSNTYNEGNVTTWMARAFPDSDSSSSDEDEDDFDSSSSDEEQAQCLIVGTDGAATGGTVEDNLGDGYYLVKIEGTSTYLRARRTGPGIYEAAT